MRCALVVESAFFVLSYAAVQLIFTFMLGFYISSIASHGIGWWVYSMLRNEGYIISHSLPVSMFITAFAEFVYVIAYVSGDALNKNGYAYFTPL